jgi:hypothetical protein
MENANLFRESGAENSKRVVERSAEPVRTVHSAIKCVAAWPQAGFSSGPRYPIEWTINEDEPGLSSDDIDHEQSAAVTFVCSVLCLTVWESIRGTVADRRHEKPNQIRMLRLQQNVLKAPPGSIRTAVESVLEFLVGLGLQLISKGPERTEKVRQNWADECELFRDNQGAFHFMATDVIACIRVQAELPDAAEMVRSLHGLMLFLVDKYVRPVILQIDAGDDDQQQVRGPACISLPVQPFTCESLSNVLQKVPEPTDPVRSPKSQTCAVWSRCCPSGRSCAGTCSGRCRTPIKSGCLHKCNRSARCKTSWAGGWQRSLPRTSLRITQTASTS